MGKLRFPAWLENNAPRDNGIVTVACPAVAIRHCARSGGKLAAAAARRGRERYYAFVATPFGDAYVPAGEVPRGDPPPYRSGDRVDVEVRYRPAEEHGYSRWRVYAVEIVSSFSPAALTLEEWREMLE